MAPRLRSTHRLSRTLVWLAILIALVPPAHAGADRAPEAGPGPDPNPGSSGQALAQVDGPVAAALEFDGGLIIGGNFQHAGGVATGSLARWNGLAWSAVGQPFDGAVCALVALQGQLVAGGDFEHAGTTALHHLALWDGTAWQPFGAGTDGPVHALATQADVILYAGGAFTHAGNVEARGVARWIGTNWSAVGTGVTGEVRALVIYNSTLVIGGDFGTIDSGGLGHHLSQFRSGAWRTLALGIDGPISALAVFEGSLVAGGTFENIDLVTPASHIARLIGETWSSIGVGVANGETGAAVRALAVVGSDLVAGGDFTLAELRSARHVARWDGFQWSALGSGTDGPVTTLAGYGGGIVAGGNFTHAGTAAAASVAAFIGGQWSPLQATAILVSDVSATSEPGGVRVAWRFAPVAMDDIGRVFVERSAAPGTTGERLPAGMLEARAAMSVLDRTPDPAFAWYRIVVERRDGAVVCAATVAAPAVQPLARMALAPIATPRHGAPVVIRYSLPAPALARLQVFDVRGRTVATIATGDSGTGTHAVLWDRSASRGRVVAPGVYFVHLATNTARATRKLVLAN